MHCKHIAVRVEKRRTTAAGSCANLIKDIVTLTDSIFPYEILNFPLGYCNIPNSKFGKIFLLILRNNASYDLNKLADSEEISIIVASNNLFVQICFKVFFLQKETFHMGNIFKFKCGFYYFIN